MIRDTKITNRLSYKMCNLNLEPGDCLESFNIYGKIIMKGDLYQVLLFRTFSLLMVIEKASSRNRACGEDS